MLIIGVAIPIYSEDLRGVFQGRLGVSQSACDLHSVRVKVTTTQRITRGFSEVSLTYTHI